MKHFLRPKTRKKRNIHLQNIGLRLLCWISNYRDMANDFESSNVQRILCGTPLFRYDLVKPPKEWSDNYKNPQYCSRNRGAKNAANFHFFFSKELTAICVGKKTLDTFDFGDLVKHPFYITSCVLTKDIRLLDISMKDPNIFFPDFILYILRDVGIEVLTQSYHNHLNNNLSFGNIAEDFNNMWLARLAKQPLSWNDQACINVNRFFGGSASYLGQCLSDYNNGFSFKEELLKRGLDGYMFTEETNDATICLCDGKCLSIPECHAVFI